MSRVDAPVVMLTNVVAPDKLGGLERYVRELAAGLVAAGRRVTVVTKQVSTDHPLSETGADGVQILRHAAPDKRDPAFAAKYPLVIGRAADVAVREAGPGAILHTHFVPPALGPALRRLPYVHTFHSPTYREILDERHDSYALPNVLQRPAVSGFRAAERLVLRRARTVVALSEFSRSEIALLDGDVASRTVVLPGGVDLDRFSPGPARASEAADGRLLLVAARRFTPRTGMFELVQAMPAVLRKHPAARLVLLGDGMSLGAVEAEVARLGLASSIDLLGRINDDEALVSWYRRADLVVMPTQLLEGFGLTTAEALGCGTPVVATPVGANPEVVGLADRRLIARDATPEGMAAAILRAVDLIRVEGRSALVPGGCVTSLGWRHIVERHEEIYDQVGAQGARGGRRTRLRRAA